MDFYELCEADRKEFLELMDEFYHTGAVLHPLGGEVLARCFEDCAARSAYVRGWLFREGAAAAGFALVALGYSTEAGGMCVQLEDIYIRPEFRGLGVGARFISFIESEYKNTARRLRLEVEPGNGKAVKLYERLGFKELGYKQMVKDLPDGI